MDKLDFNIGLFVFIIGATLFVLAPLDLFGAVRTVDISLLALSLESVGVVLGLVVFFRKAIVELGDNRARRVEYISSGRTEKNCDCSI